MRGAPGAVSKGGCSQSAHPGHLLGRKSRGLCWKSAFNLGFLFSAPGDAQTGLSFKLLHTSFSKLSSQSRCWGRGGVMKQGREALGAEHSPPKRRLSSGPLAINNQPSLATSCPVVSSNKNATQSPELHFPHPGLQPLFSPFPHARQVAQLEKAGAWAYLVGEGSSYISPQILKPKAPTLMISFPLHGEAGVPGFGGPQI